MAGCSPSECDGICWCSLIFLSSQANSSPKPYFQLSTRHTSPSPSPLLGWGACGGSESTSGMAGSHHCYFPFPTLSADVAQAPCLLHLKFGARWELTAQELEASVMPSYSWWVLHWGSKLQCEFTFHHKGTAVICSLEEQCCFTTTEGLCRHSSSSRFLRLVEEQQLVQPLYSSTELICCACQRGAAFLLRGYKGGVCGFVPDAAISAGCFFF